MARGSVVRFWHGKHLTGVNQIRIADFVAVGLEHLHIHDAFTEIFARDLPKGEAGLHGDDDGGGSAVGATSAVRGGVVIRAPPFLARQLSAVSAGGVSALSGVAVAGASDVAPSGAARAAKASMLSRLKGFQSGRSLDPRRSIGRRAGYKARQQPPAVAAHFPISPAVTVSISPLSR